MKTSSKLSISAGITVIIIALMLILGYFVQESPMLTLLCCAFICVIAIIFVLVYDTVDKIDKQNHNAD